MILWSQTAMAIEIPKYQILEKVDRIELRQYDAQIQAETIVSGSRDDAIGDAFRILADYIFGNNTVKQKIEMTAPVTQTTASEKIAMTAPVTQQKAADNRWRVQFTMPQNYTMETLPKPNDKRVILNEIKPYRSIAIRFTGWSTQNNLQNHLNELQDYIKKYKIDVLQEPIYAFYNPPWTLPFLRRNEIQFIIKEEK